MKEIAFQGEQGAFSEQAVFKHYGRDVTPVPCHDLSDVFQAVNNREVDEGLVPVENAQAGTINKTYDMLQEFELNITGETYLEINHCLMANEGTRLEDVKRVYSHPQALMQCEEFLQELNVQQHPAQDTAGGARRVKDSGSKEEAAVASSIAAEEHDLTILAEHIETRSKNTTRFLSIGLEATRVTEDCKTSILFETRDIPAALYKCLGGFATNGVNLTKLESRPEREANWKYMFYLDFEGHREDSSVQRALEELDYFTVSCDVISSYPKGESIQRKAEQ